MATKIKTTAEQEYENAMAWLEALDPDTTPAEVVPAELAHIGHAAWTVREAENDLRSAVALARKAGRSWADIGRILGISRQAAQQRFGEESVTSDSVTKRALGYLGLKANGA